jgi:GNAT superfamily N-acetyltransferase
MPFRHLWAYERGALWAMDLDGGTRVPVTPYVAATLTEAAPDVEPALATAMGLTDSCALRRRFAAGSRCFVAWVDGAIAAYGWASWGIEDIGELERSLRMRPDEAYIWDCATLPLFRRQRLYSALLAHMAVVLRDEGIRRLWIGASLRNSPSLRGFATAGFQPAVRIIYARLFTLSHTWVFGEATAPPALIADARQALIAAR